MAPCIWLNMIMSRKQALVSRSLHTPLQLPRTHKYLYWLKNFLFPAMVTKQSRIPASRSFLASIPVLHPAPAQDAIQDSIRLRLSCSTPTFNQSTKLRALPMVEPPVSPAMQKGNGIGTLRRYTDYKDTLDDDTVASSSAGSSLSRKSSSSSLGSRFRLRLRRSRLSDDSSSDGQSSRSFSLHEKPLPPLPSLFSRCSSPYDGSSDGEEERGPVSAPPPFRIRRKPVPSYIPASDAVSTFDLPISTLVSDDESAAEENTVQRLGPNVFMTADDASAWSLATAFTHIVRITRGDGIGRAHITFEPETRIHTLHLPVLPPLPNLRLAPAPSAGLTRDLEQIRKSSNSRSRRRFTIRRKPVPKALVSWFSDSEEETDESEDDSSGSDSDRGLYASFPPPPSYSHADLVTTQRFLADYGRQMTVEELESLLCDEKLRPLSESESGTELAPLGLRPTDVTTALAYLCPHPFAAAVNPEIRRRVLLVTPKGETQLAREAMALGTCYLANAEDTCVRSTFESVKEASRDARRLFMAPGSADDAADYLKDVWRRVEGGSARH